MGPRRVTSATRDIQPSGLERIHSFAPIERRDATVLILGSMPGVASLDAGRYYAHPRNSFWRIMTELLSIDPSATYEQRLDALVSNRIALWDVLHSCERTGSLDTSINRETQTANDFESFFRTHPDIRCVLLNGTKAWDAFRRHAATMKIDESLTVTRLPSTSPANASWSYERKLEAWRSALMREPRR
ncbi:MAG TPA: DNA-deoxyinosine glycosylase [Candidatus Limnocylindrales bacterium]|nr:DNA-deoxyinosine glycosylase [Candidatus Limnocylindrales bacterium]